MSATYFRSFHRRIGRQWAERINSLRQIRDRIIGAAERVFGNDGELVPIPVIAVRRRDQRRSRD